MGRAAFLGVTIAGLSSLAWGRPAWEAVSGLFPDDLASVLPQPSGSWRIYTVAPSMPRLAPETFRLEVEVGRGTPASLSLADLRGLPVAEQVSDFHCVTGWVVKNVGWRGTRIRDVLEAAGGTPRGGGLSFVSAEEPYVDSLTLRQALLPDVMLAWEMGGKPIPRAHGAPLRLVVPRMYGYKSVKWVQRIVATPEPELGYWEQRGYDRDAWIGRSNGL